VAYIDDVMAPMYETALAPMPSWLIARAQTHTKNGNTRLLSPEEWGSKLKGAPEGQRHNVATEIAGHFLGLLGPHREREVAEIMMGFAARCEPPFPEREVLSLVRDLARRDRVKVVVARDAEPTTPAAMVAPAEATALRVPDAAMIGLARDFATTYARYLESPVSFFYFAFLTYFGAVIARKVTIDSALTPEPRLYTVVVGESADTRKTTALVKTEQFFESLGQRPAVLFGAGSAEGLAAELKESPSLLMHLDELKTFVDKAKHENSVLLPMVSTLFERGDYDNRVKAEKVSVCGASLSLLAACTNDTFATMWDERFMAIGLPNRLWLVTDKSTRRHAIPDPIPVAEIETLQKRVRQELDRIDYAYTANGLRAVAYPLATEARAIFEGWYHSREASIFERRLDTYGHRLMVEQVREPHRSPGLFASIAALRLRCVRQCRPVDRGDHSRWSESKET
jgi:hypothetical protein